MTRGILTVVCLLSMMVLLSCSDDDNPVATQTIEGSGDLISVQRTLEDFQTVSLTTVGTVRLTSGAQQSCSLTVDDNVEQHILTTVTGGVLRISSSSDVRLKNFDLTVYLTMNDLEGVSLSGVGSIIAENQFNSSSVDIELPGVGNILMDLNVFRLRSSLSGVGSINLSGIARHHQFYHSAVGTIAAFELITDTTIANLSGIGNAEVYVNDTLHVAIGGSGSLYYRGDPGIAQEITGTGSVIDAN